MNNSAKSTQLRAQLAALDTALVSSGLQVGASPAPKKINEGDDRWGGYP
jgi:hypothetical protein